jgi:hypothetical protein
MRALPFFPYFVENLNWHIHRDYPLCWRDRSAKIPCLRQPGIVVFIGAIGRTRTAIIMAGTLYLNKEYYVRIL